MITQMCPEIGADHPDCSPVLGFFATVSLLKSDTVTPSCAQKEAPRERGRAARVPVQCCCRRRISACRPFSVLACSRCRNCRFFWALWSWFSRLDAAILGCSDPATNRWRTVTVGYPARTQILTPRPGSAGIPEFYC